MIQPQLKLVRVLAIAPSSRGFGFAVLEEDEQLVNWGEKSVKGDKNAQSLIKVEALIAHYKPTLIALQDHLSKDFRRSDRIRTLHKQIVGLASQRKVKVNLLTPTQVRRVFLVDDKATKHAVAELVSKRFPEELGYRLPPKRKAWMSEDSRMGIFQAVALAVASRLLQ